jgi:hypothetical protein
MEVAVLNRFARVSLSIFVALRKDTEPQQEADLEQGNDASLTAAANEIRKVAAGAKRASEHKNAAKAARKTVRAKKGTNMSKSDSED